MTEKSHFKSCIFSFVCNSCNASSARVWIYIARQKLLFFRIEIPHWIETKSCQLPPLHVDMCLKSSRTALSVLCWLWLTFLIYNSSPMAELHRSYSYICRHMTSLHHAKWVFFRVHEWTHKRLSSIISSLSRRLRLVAMTWRSEVEEVPNKKQPQRCCVFWSLNSATQAYPLINCFEGFRVSNRKSPRLPLSLVPVCLQPSHFDVTRR